MAYVEGFVLPVPTGSKDVYRDFAARLAPLFMKHGALELVEGWGDDVPHGKLTDFHRAVQATEGETVVFAWVLWPSREVRDAAHARMEGAGDMPFDGRRMIFGGFRTLLHVKAGDA